MRHEQRRHAEKIGGPRSHRDQREHVQRAVAHRLHAAHEERPSRPQHHRRGECKLNPGRQARCNGDQPQMTAHFECEHRYGEKKPDPEPPRHVRQFGVGAALRRHRFRLQRHATDRAASGPGLTYLRVHRAGVDRAGRGRGRCVRFLGRKIFFRIRVEFGFAACAAEPEIVTPVMALMLRGRGIDTHAADGITGGIESGAVCAIFHSD